MTDPIRIFVGTDERQAAAERVLSYSIKRNTTRLAEIVFMRAGDEGFTGWRNQPKKPLDPGCWATRFTNFRYAIPELAGFQGRAIYLDSDMIAVGDLRELWEAPRKKPWESFSIKRTDVSVIDCAFFKDKGWWPRIEMMKRAALMGSQFRELLWRNGAFHPGIDERWDHLDNYSEGWTKLTHFTRMSTQPWRPWPEVFGYPKRHPNPKAQDLWDRYYALASKTPESAAPPRA